MTALLGQRDARRDGWRLGNSARAPRLYGGGESADLHPGLVGLPGSQSTLFAVASPDGNGTAPLCPKFPRCRPTPLSGQIARENLSLTKPDQPGSFALREVTKSDPCARLHVPEHEASHDREVVNLCPEPGNVCRA